MTYHQKIKKFSEYLEKLNKQEIEDEYFTIDGYKLSKTFAEIFECEELDRLQSCRITITPYYNPAE